MYSNPDARPRCIDSDDHKAGKYDEAGHSWVRACMFRPGAAGRPWFPSHVYRIRKNLRCLYVRTKQHAIIYLPTVCIDPTKLATLLFVVYLFYTHTVPVLVPAQTT